VPPAALPLAFVAGAALVVVAILMTLLALALAPRSWRPRSAFVGVLAVAGAYVALRLGFESGLIKWLDHDFLEKIGSEVDELSTWFVGFMGALLVLAAFRYLRR
jgi:hypothetical protein